MEYYSAIKNNEIMLFAGKWMEQYVSILDEVSQIYKDICHIFSLIFWKLKKRKQRAPKL
jgi:hypothetical protein